MTDVQGKNMTMDKLIDFINRINHVHIIFKEHINEREDVLYTYNDYPYYNRKLKDIRVLKPNDWRRAEFTAIVEPLDDYRFRLWYPYHCDSAWIYAYSEVLNLDDIHKVTHNDYPNDTYSMRRDDPFSFLAKHYNNIQFKRIK